MGVSTSQEWLASSLSNWYIIQVSDYEGKARIDMRSKSRDGLVDAGANAKRIQTFFEQLDDTKGKGK